MQPAQPAQRTVEARWIKAADVDPAIAHVPPVGVAGFREAAHPIVEQSDRYAFLCLGDERFGEPLADVVIANNIIFKMNRFFCAVDRFQPCRVILVCVSEKADAVAVNKRRAGGAREGLGCQNARRGRCFAGGFVQLCVGHAPVL